MKKGFLKEANIINLKNLRKMRLSDISIPQQRAFKLLLDGARMHLIDKIDTKEATVVDQNNNRLEISLKTFSSLIEKGFLIHSEDPSFINISGEHYLLEIFELSEEGKEVAEELQIEVDITDLVTKSHKAVTAYDVLVRKEQGIPDISVRGFKGLVKGSNCQLRSRSDYFNGRIQIKLEELYETPNAAVQAKLENTLKERREILTALEFNEQTVKALRHLLDNVIIAQTSSDSDLTFIQQKAA